MEPNFSKSKQFMRIKYRSRIKVFAPFEDVFKPSSSIYEMMIPFSCVYKKSSNPVMRGSRVETIEKSLKEYKQLLEEDQYFRSYF